jgi:hypothetical protein
MLVQLYSTGSSEPAYSLQNTVKQCRASFHKVTMRRKKRIGVVLKYIEKEKCVQCTGVKGLKEINETGLICQKGFKKFSIRVDFGSQVSSHSYYNINWSLHCKKRLAFFPSPAGKSLTKLPLAAGIINVTSLLGTGKLLTFY